MSESVVIEASGPIATIWLNRPPVNALDETSLHELVETLELADNHPAIRVVIIASALGNVFCAGGDLKFWPHYYASDAHGITRIGQRAFLRIERMTKPSIAAIQGHVIGDGLSLALACDIRLASGNSIFVLPEVGYGFIPGWGTIGRLLSAAGMARAAELLFTGEPINAEQALAFGLVNRVTGPNDLMASALTIAKRIATQPPVAIQYAKAALRGNPAARSPDQADWEAECFAAVWGSDEWKQGLKSFNGVQIEREESLQS
jgi:enoyl-CoA hydratase/carnithine racemase